MICYSSDKVILYKLKRLSKIYKWSKEKTQNSDRRTNRNENIDMINKIDEKLVLFQDLVKFKIK